MNTGQHRDRVLALAGIFQACSLVKQVAYRGTADEVPYTSSIESIFAIDADSVEAIFGGLAGLAHGLGALQRELTQQAQTRDAEVIRYAVNLLHLERRLVKRPKLMATLRQGIETASTQASHFDSTHPNVIASLADLYVRTVSTLTPRVMVKGEPSVLSNPDNAARVRALLLAGVRSAVLWRQRGGNRFNLLIHRRRILDTAKELIRPAGMSNPN